MYTLAIPATALRFEATRNMHTILPEAPCFLYSLAELEASPSILDGVTPSDERLARIYEMQYISAESRSMIERKGSTVNTAYTAMIMWHRFYMRRSLRRYPPALTSTACLLLASKVCEPVLHIHEFVRAYLRRTEGLLDIGERTEVRDDCRRTAAALPHRDLP